jgi:predicted O-methyltransferase YrrM
MSSGKKTPVQLISFVIKAILKKITEFVSIGDVNPFHDYPFGKEPRADSDTYLAIWEATKNKQYPLIGEFEEVCGFSIEKEWLHELALHTQVVVKESEICYQHGRLLYAKLSEYCDKHKSDSLNILETGTARGFSTLCMAKALNDRSREGKIVSIDPLPHNIPMYWNCIDDTESEKSRAQLLGTYFDLIGRHICFLEGKSEDVLKRLELSRINFAFLDGGHDYEEVKLEVCYVKERQEMGDIIFFDDYQLEYFPGIVKAVKELESNNSYRVLTIVANDQRGYAIAEKL